MAEAKRDQNFVPTLIGVSSSDGVTPINAYVNPATHRLLVDIPGGSGSVTNIATGTGLTGGPITTTGTISLNTKLSPMDTLTGNSLKVLRVNAGETAVEYATVGGAGTVTNTGTLTLNSIVLGNGGADTKVVAGITTNGTAQLVLGVNVTTLGTIKMFGNTSGDVTIQPTAAAGTATVQTLPTVTGTLVNRVATANGMSGSNTDGALTLTLGAITPTTVNGNTITTGSSTYTGTAAQTYTFPTTTATIARTDAGQTFTGVQTMTSPALTTPAITGLATGSGVASAATASTLMARDANANASADNFIDGYTTTATATATTTITVNDTHTQIFTGVLAQTLVLPVTSTLVLGQQFYIINLSTGAVTVQSSGLNNIIVLQQNQSVKVTCILASGTTASSWTAPPAAGTVGNATVGNTLPYYSGTGTTLSENIHFIYTNAGGSPKLNIGATGNQGSLGLTGASSGSVSINVAAIASGFLTLPNASDTLVAKATTDTLTNKRITKRSVSTAGPGATPSVNTDTTDVAHFTALAVAITSMTTNLTGTPVEGDTLRIDFTDNGTARAITWGTSFEASTVALPTTTVISTRLDVGFVWNTVTSKWRCVAVA